MNIRSIAIASLLPVLFQAAPAVASEQDFHDIAAEVSAERIERDIRTLAGFGTRHTLSETGSDTRGIGAARRWIEAEFNRISNACGGCLEVFTVSGVVSGEEQGLHGGRIIAQYAIDNGWNLDAVLNNDMIGNITGVNGVSNNTTARVFPKARAMWKPPTKPTSAASRAGKSILPRAISPAMSMPWRTVTSPILTP